MFTEKDEEIIEMFRDELKHLEEKSKIVENEIWEDISEYNFPDVKQTCILSIFPTTGDPESGICVGHLAELYREYIHWNGKLKNS